jgi:hypothetical protein
MIIVKQDNEISVTEAAALFGITRPTFHKLAEKHGIKEVTEINPARSRPLARVYDRAAVYRVYRELFGKDPE